MGDGDGCEGTTFDGKWVGHGPAHPLSHAASLPYDAGPISGRCIGRTSHAEVGEIGQLRGGAVSLSMVMHCRACSAAARVPPPPRQRSAPCPSSSSFSPHSTAPLSVSESRDLFHLPLSGPCGWASVFPTPYSLWRLAGRGAESATLRRRRVTPRQGPPPRRVVRRVRETCGPASAQHYHSPPRPQSPLLRPWIVLLRGGSQQYALPPVSEISPICLRPADRVRWCLCSSPRAHQPACPPLDVFPRCCCCCRRRGSPPKRR